MKRWIISFALVWPIIGLCVLLRPSVSVQQAEALATASVAASPTITNVPRAGIDVSSSAYYTGLSQFNMFQNSGFEWPQFYQDIEVAAVPSSSAFMQSQGDNPQNIEPTGFWAGTNNCTVVVGTCTDSTNNYCYANTATTASGGCGSGGTCNAGTQFSLNSSTGSVTGGKLASSYSAGTTSISVNSLTAGQVIPRNTEFIIAGDSQIYVTQNTTATANGSGVVAITITNTTLQTSPSSGTAVTFGIQQFACSGSCPTLAAPSSVANPGDFAADIVGCGVTVTNPTAWSNLGSSFGNYVTGWGASSQTTVTLSATEAYQGNSSLEINASSTSPDINTNWDGGSGIEQPGFCNSTPADICTVDGDCGSGTCGHTVWVNHPMTSSENWVFSFYAAAASSGMSCTAVLDRTGDSDMINQTYTILPTGSCSNAGSQGALNWCQYSTSFHGNDISSDLGQLNFTFTCSGGTGYFDNIALYETDETSGFSPEAYTSMAGLQPGFVRMAPTDVSGGVATATQVEGTSYIMPPMGQLEANGVDGTTFSYGEMTGLANALGADPWYTVPIAWPDSEYQSFGAQMCSWEGSYGFPMMVLECGNENWNGGEGTYFKTVDETAYGLACARVFNEVKTGYDGSCSASDSDVKYVYNELTGVDGVMASVQAQINSATSGFPNTSQYGISNNFYQAASSGTTLAQVSASLMAQPGIINAIEGGNLFNDTGQSCKAEFGASTGCNQIISWYEGGAQTSSGTDGSATDLISSESNVGFVSAAWEVQELLQILSAAPTPQAGIISHTFQMAQASNNGVLVWGITPGTYGFNQAFGPIYPWYRPEALGLKLYNSALNGYPKYYPVSGLPSGITGAVFANSGGTNFTAAFSSANSTSTSVSITFPSGTVPTVADTIPEVSSLADNNEGTSTLVIGSLSGGVSYSGQTASFTIPAYAAVALLQSGVVPPGNANTNPASMVTARR